jgi:hypothetical protein
MATAGPNYCGTAADDSTVGTITWSSGSLSNGLTDNGLTAFLDAVINTGEVTHYFKATNFGFSIPAGATINGITVEIKRRDASATNKSKDSSVKLVKGGTIGGNDKAAAGTYPTTLTYATYGSASDLWGQSFAASDINASNFGVVIACTDNGAGNANPEIDAIRITIDYTNPAGERGIARGIGRGIMRGIK